MKRYLSTLCLLLVFATGTAFGQNYTFKVLANKGNNQVKSGGDWEQLKTGASLQETDELKLSENAYLGLVHVSGKTMELKEPGTHKVQALSSQMETGGSSVASKYADFVLSKMSAEGKKNRLSATGAVHRGSNDAITLFMPSSVGVYNKEAIIRWDSLEGDHTYKVTINNMFEEELMTIETNEPKIAIDLSKEQIAKENTILISVVSTDDEPLNQKLMPSESCLRQKQKK
ncbi:MAG: hypothetical protein R3345_02370 [Fulvivirga sp.]|nr:hypothetical protein [Fulvivirga sp.]